MDSNQAGSNDSDQKSRLSRRVRRAISVVTGCFLCAVGTVLFWTDIRVALKLVPDDLGWFWGALGAAVIFLLVALFVYFVAQRTLWDLSGLLVVPFALVVIGLWFTAQQDARQQQIENQRAEAERELAVQRAQDEALQAYLDQMSTLLLDKNLRGSGNNSEVRTNSEVQTLARARTLTVLGRLDPSRKTAVMQFLVEADLVQRVEGREPIIKLGQPPPPAAYTFAFSTIVAGSGTDLSGAYLLGVDLSGAYLSRADLSEANLSTADLRGANLTLGGLSQADLSYADLS